MSATKKVVINACYGGFSLSPRATKRLAELQGRECYFFNNRAPDGGYDLHRYFPISIEQAESQGLFWSAFDVADPNGCDYSAHILDDFDAKRDDPLLIQVVEELGAGHRTGASGSCANLRIVEIPADVEYVIDEYDGSESIHEKHRSWP